MDDNADRKGDVSPGRIRWVAAILLLFVAVLIHLIVVLWPPDGASGSPSAPAGYETVTFFRWLSGSTISLSMVREVRLILLVIVVGALGTFIHVGTSFSDYVGNETLRKSWLVWYLLKPLLGASLALLFYLAIRGGLLTTSTKASDVNVFGVCALAGLAGLFSKQAGDKLQEVFCTLFKTDGDAERKDKLLRGTRPKITKLVPSQIAVGSPTAQLGVEGIGFDAKARVRFDKSLYSPTNVSAEWIEVLVGQKDLATARAIDVVVVNPPDKGGESEPAKFTVGQG